MADHNTGETVIDISNMTRRQEYVYSVRVFEIHSYLNRNYMN